MSRHEFLTVDVFTATRFGGNPLAVFPNARGIPEAALAALAAEFNLSETTFVLPPEDPAHTARVRIFGPREELPFAGHPNVGTAFVLAHRQPNPPARFLFEEPAGLVAVDLLRDASGTVTGARVAAPRPLTVAAEVPPDIIAACAGLTAAEIVTALHPPAIASVGMPFAIAEVADIAALARAAPDLAALRAAATRFPAAPGFKLLLHCRPGADPTRRRVRMFAPLSGVTEDPATGSAAAALVALLLARSQEAFATLDIDQGEALGRPSRIEAAARRAPDGAIIATVAGSCVPVLAGYARL